jgi:hypothetical protein
MLDEHAQKLFDQKGAECERLRRLLRSHRVRLSTRARKIVNELSTENARLRAALASYMREDE